MDQLFKIIGIAATIALVSYGLLRLIFGNRWLHALARHFFLGKDLVKSSKQLAAELPGQVKRETLAEVASHIFLRFTRIGLFALIVALTPILLLVSQNKMLKIQNERIEDQNALMEGQRRSSLVFLMGNLLDEISNEIDQQRTAKADGDVKLLDSLGYSLSNSLVNRISSLSRGFLPYRILVDGKLSEDEYSIERGQLLLALAESNLDSVTNYRVFTKSDFSSSYLRKVNFANVDLSNVRMPNSDLRQAVFNRVTLNGSVLDGSDLRGAEFSYVTGRNTELQGVSLQNSLFSYCRFYAANFSNARLNESELLTNSFECSKMIEADLTSVRIGWTSVQVLGLDTVVTIKKGHAPFKSVNFYEAILKDVKPKFRFIGNEVSLFSIFGQACSLRNCSGLNLELEKNLIDSLPELFSNIDNEQCCFGFLTNLVPIDSLNSRLDIETIIERFNY